ncbi:hypothetical protein FB451DRAFT_1439787 [Mycena latifolia]|nr:hypothetical protein FB451DRAFT_1439787 [Mycena latifolia]
MDRQKSPWFGAFSPFFTISSYAFSAHPSFRVVEGLVLYVSGETFFKIFGRWQAHPAQNDNADTAYQHPANGVTWQHIPLALASTDPNACIPPKAPHSGVNSPKLFSESLTSGAGGLQAKVPPSEYDFLKPRELYHAPRAVPFFYPLRTTSDVNFACGAAAKSSAVALLRKIACSAYYTTVFLWRFYRTFRTPLLGGFDTLSSSKFRLRRDSKPATAQVHASYSSPATWQQAEFSPRLEGMLGPKNPPVGRDLDASRTPGERYAAPNAHAAILIQYHAEWTASRGSAPSSTYASASTNTRALRTHWWKPARFFFPLKKDKFYWLKLYFFRAGQSRARRRNIVVWWYKQEESLLLRSDITAMCCRSIVDPSQQPRHSRTRAHSLLHDGPNRKIDRIGGFAVLQYVVHREGGCSSRPSNGLGQDTVMYSIRTCKLSVEWFCIRSFVTSKVLRDIVVGESATELKELMHRATQDGRGRPSINTCSHMIPYNAEGTCSAETRAYHWE